MSLLVNALKRMQRRFLSRSAIDAFHKAAKRLGPKDIAIDCGANVGDYTLVLAGTGATVHAFEPDPVAFEVLVARTSGLANVALYNQAVSNSRGLTKLYLHENRSSDPLFTSTGSSLLATKTNVNAATFVEVEAIRFSDFVTSVGTVALLKIDIEGHEIEVINDLIDTGAIHNIRSAFVELHDKKNPHLSNATEILRSRISKSGVPFDLTWH